MKLSHFISGILFIANISYCTTAFMTDNDMFLNKIGLGLLDEDRNYTMGVAFIHTNDSLNEHFNRNSISDNIITAIDLKDTNSTRRYKKMASSWQFVSTNFTPDDLTDSNVIKNDRPYASLLYWGDNKSYTIVPKSTNLNHQFKNFTRINLRYRLGFVGLQIGKNTQIAIHEQLNDGDTKNPHTPKGWNHQISNGGEPVAFLGGDISKILTIFDHLQCNPQLEIGLGYHTYSSESMGIKLGFLSNRDLITSIGDIPRFTTIHPASNENNNYNEKEENIFNSQLYVYGNFGFIQIVYNELLNGGLLHSDYKLCFDQINHLMYYGEAGLVIMFKNWIGFQGSVLLKSSELKVGEPRDHIWGRFSLIIGQKLNPLNISRNEQ